MTQHAGAARDGNLPARPDSSLAGQRVGLSYETSTNLFYRDLADGVRAAAAHYSASVVIRESGQSAEQQRADIAALLAAGVDALLVCPYDSDALGPALVAAEGVPVVTIDHAVAGSRVVSHVTSDNVLGGRLAGDYLASLLEGHGEVGIVGLSVGTSIRDRVRGFREALARHGGIRVVEEIDGGAEQRRSQEAAATMLRAYPRLAGIFGINGVTVQGVLAAVRHANREQSVMVVGYDATTQGCEEILHGGPLRGEVAQFPAVMGRTAVDLWARHAGGEVVPLRVEIPVELVTRENVERFTGAERLLEARRGDVRVAGERVIFFPVRGYQMMLNEIHRTSPDLVRHIVYRSGFVLGQSIAEQVRDLYPDPRDLLFILLEDLSRGGFGAFELVLLDLQAGQAEVRGHDLFEAMIAPGLDWARTPRCVDYYCSGRLAGYLTAILGRPAACEEIACQARGEPACHFAITAAALDAPA